MRAHRPLLAAALAAASLLALTAPAAVADDGVGPCWPWQRTCDVMEIANYRIVTVDLVVDYEYSEVERATAEDEGAHTFEGKLRTALLGTAKGGQFEMATEGMAAANVRPLAARFESSGTYVSREGTWDCAGDDAAPQTDAGLGALAWRDAGDTATKLQLQLPMPAFDCDRGGTGVATPELPTTPSEAFTVYFLKRYLKGGATRGKNRKKLTLMVDRTYSWGDDGLLLAPLTPHEVDDEDVFEFSAKQTLKGRIVIEKHRRL